MNMPEKVFLNNIYQNILKNTCIITLKNGENTPFLKG